MREDWEFKFGLFFSFSVSFPIFRSEVSSWESAFLLFKNHTEEEKERGEEEEKEGEEEEDGARDRKGE